MQEMWYIRFDYLRPKKVNVADTWFRALNTSRKT